MSVRDSLRDGTVYGEGLCMKNEKRARKKPSVCTLTLPPPLPPHAFSTRKHPRPKGASLPQPQRPRGAASCEVIVMRSLKTRLFDHARVLGRGLGMLWFWHQFILN